MLDEMLGTYGSNLTIAVVGVAAGFLCLILVLWLIRGRGGPSPFLRGGKNRQPRLQVLDAAAVDARRRLVLVRRDDVEHLIMIGGPTDVVIESSIVDGRSPPYHTMMKTISEPEKTSIAPAEEPRLSASEDRSVEFSAPAPRVVASAAKAEKPAPQKENTESFAWIGSEAVDAAPPVKPTEAAAPVQPVVPKPEAAKPADTPAVPMQPAPRAATAEPKVADIVSRLESRMAEPRAAEPARAAAPSPVVDFPTIEPRTSAAVAAAPAPAPVATAFATATAVPMPEPVNEPPVKTQRDQPLTVDVETPGRTTEPHFDIDTPRSRGEAPSLDNAVDLLEAARERVFQQPHAEMPPEMSVQPPSVTPAPAQRPTVMATQTPAASLRPPIHATAPAKPLGSDFERILEEEMATNLAGANSVPPIGPATPNGPTSQLPRRDPGMPRVTGASQEPAMQNEIARIFGEMSVTKDDR
ncbi:hypothetical protein GAO09_14995 [Rhizobiales bacterium RZME27]|jgi:hypothetical protein|uniref:Flagellar biosynthesis protein FliO n=1 Tax=Endobacterium cereale TaxID=2663029 RepID=A0A6A8A7Z1_9HYPH|nr:flagellar biosynthetic protein FliO [Endobacterium cereale]MEB2843553.1 flagellar biosynthetic protein FliO [Endobacterium cereale]MQY47343.1 hypothetical protein [Endobacterium cereale]